MDYLFETEHLRIRMFQSGDAEPLYKNHLEEEVKNGFPMKATQVLKKRSTQ